MLVGMYDLLSLAKMADDVYESSNSPVLLGNWTRQDKPRKYGNFYACAYKYKGTGDIVVVSIRGTVEKKQVQMIAERKVSFC